MESSHASPSSSRAHRAHPVQDSRSKQNERLEGASKLRLRRNLESSSFVTPLSRVAGAAAGAGALLEGKP